MTEEQELYFSIGQKIKRTEQSQMFGKPCFKINGKAFMCFYENHTVFKLTGDCHKDAVGLKGAQLFDPSGKKRAMKEWVQVPFQHKDKWAKFAMQAAKYAYEM